MTFERRTELQDRLREVLGERPAATLWSMLPGSEDLATKPDLTEVQNVLRGEIVGVRDELKGEIFWCPRGAEGRDHRPARGRQG